MNQSKIAGLKIIRGTLAVLALSAAAAHADVVEDWSRIALDTVLSQQQNPVRAARDMGTVHIAMFEAMNFVEGAYAPKFLVKPPVISGMSSQVAAAAASHHVLVELYPQSKVALDAALRHSLESLPGNTDYTGAMDTGRQLGAIVRVVRNSERFPEEAQTAQPNGDTTRDSVAWASTLARHVGSGRLKPIEGARLFAMAALAVDQAYSAARDVLAQYGVEHPCVSCTAGAAVDVILASNATTKAGPAVEVASIGAAPALPATLTQRNAESDEMGVTIGQQVLLNYPAVK